MPRTNTYHGRIAQRVRDGKYVPYGIVLDNGKKQATIVVNKKAQNLSANERRVNSEKGDVRVLFSERPTRSVLNAVEAWRRLGRENPSRAQEEISKAFKGSDPLKEVLRANLKTNLPVPFVRFIRLYFKK